MKFSLKQLILFVTFAALLSGVAGYAYQRGIEAQWLAKAERAKAKQRLAEALESEAAQNSLFQSLQFDLGISEKNASGPNFNYSILHWNVESGGKNPATIAAQLIELGQYDIIGLSEVANPEPYVDAITSKCPDDYDFLRGNTGMYNGREDDRLLLCVDNTKFLLIEFAT